MSVCIFYRSCEQVVANFCVTEVRSTRFVRDLQLVAACLTVYDIKNGSPAVEMSLRKSEKWVGHTNI